ncbi:uncharacterized protein MELLADRAFT_94291 [Melampsora larici-populina 98AG31]|uniref:Tyrosinase copper-binding domain-containing protein n=1 Tax=Melampsora larici-populina (strain 98AG31 / pathotype 3-4-7) TaxID=747676 RepID=F4S770_MELLP|nr:uncharacterized protein MELLADRAFT_94291 [Melampsora larici-populina 98AG31]EGF99459.1 hypothetical protein MELLADRAFT_94291 [Melampsora larici-populina 98AG31]
MRTRPISIHITMMSWQSRIPILQQRRPVGGHRLGIFWKTALFLAIVTATLCQTPTSDPSHVERRNEQYCPNPAVRVSWYSLSSAEKTAMQDAIMCLLTQPSKMKYPGAISRYDDLVYVHQAQSDFPGGKDLLHVTGRFLHWHRLQLALFELLLRVECGYSGPMAYWDERVDAGKFRDAGIIKDFGGTGNENGYVVDGRFGYTIANLGPSMDNTRRYLSRKINDTASAFASERHYRVLMGQDSFIDFMQSLRNFQHLSGHVGVGRDMAGVQTAPVDPLFWFHHGYVDNDRQGNDPARIFDLNNAGYETQGPPFRSVTWQTALPFLGLADDVPLYAGSDTQGGFLCYTYK